MQRILDYGFHILMLACISVAMMLSYVFGIGLILRDRPQSLAWGVILLSPVMMYVLRVIELSRLDKPGNPIVGALQIFNPKKQSWAFMFGDTFLLSFAMIGVTNGWEYVPSSSWFNSLTWVAGAVGLGVLLSVCFALFDWPRYTRSGSEAALVSPTKVWHDWVVFPVLMSLLLFAGVPQIIRYGSFHTVIALFAVAVFTALCVADLVRDNRGTLNPDDQHMLWDPVEARPISV